MLKLHRWIFAEQHYELRKPTNVLKLEYQRSRLNVLLQHINFIASRKSVNGKDIATYALKLMSNVEHDRKVSNIYSEILETGTFALSQNQVG